MKYLLVLAVVLIGFWLWRNGRQAESEGTAPRRTSGAPKRSPDVMVACQECGTHLPHSEAVHGRQGDYCCTEHLQLREGR